MNRKLYKSNYRPLTLSEKARRFALMATLAATLATAILILTTCAGIGCSQRTVRPQANVEPILADCEVTRLCYAGFSFFRPLEQFPAVLAPLPTDRESEPCPCS